MLIVFVACNEDDDVPQTWLSLGEVQANGESPDDDVIVLDNGKIITPTNGIPSYTDGERVAVSYSYVSDIAYEATMHDADIYYIDDVLTKDIIDLTIENEDEMGNDRIHICEDDIWIASNYLNIYMTYYGSGKFSHFVNMVLPYENAITEDGRTVLEFKHNAYNDTPYFMFASIVSFDMESLRGDDDKIDFVVRVDNYDGHVFEWEGSYVFGAPETSSVNLSNMPDSEELE